MIHAARQSGKTILLRALARHDDAENNYYVIYCLLENFEGVSDIAIGIPANEVFNNQNLYRVSYISNEILSLVEYNESDDRSLLDDSMA